MVRVPGYLFVVARKIEMASRTCRPITISDPMEGLTYRDYRQKTNGWEPVSH